VSIAQQLLANVKFSLCLKSGDGMQYSGSGR